MLRALLALAVTLALAVPALAERRVALVMGADAYRTVRPLSNAVNDAVAVQGLLESLGFEVFLETNRDLRRMRRALEDFAEDAAGADLAVLFFAGHGVEIGGRNLLLPVDAAGDTPEALAASALPLDEIVATLRAVAPAALVILDACRDDPFAGLPTDPEGRGATALLRPAAGPAVTPGLGRVGRADGLLFAFAAAPGATAADGLGANSPFTEALVRYFGTPGLELRGALTLVQQEVYDRSRGAQLPYVESGLPRLVFTAAPAGELPERERLLMAMADLTPDLRAEIEAVAAARAMPLAPLYAAALSADLARAAPGERAAQLAEAADAYATFRADIRRFASDDPRVQSLRAEAEAQLALGAFETARAHLTEAAAIDAASRTGLRENLIARTLSEAETHSLNATAARADLRYRLAIEDYARTAALYGEAAGLGGGGDAFAGQFDALVEAAALQRLLGDLAASDAGWTAALRVAEAWMEQVAAAGEVSLDAARNAGIAVSGLAEIRKERGLLDEAAEYLDAARSTLGELAAALPEVDFLRHDLFIAHLRAGDVAVLQLRPDLALPAFDAALAVAVALDADFPEGGRYLREVSVALNRRGDLHFEAGRLAEAEADYAAGLAVMEGRAGDAVEARQDRLVSLSKLGQTAQARGDHGTALAVYSEVRDLAQALVAADPENAVMQRWLAVAQFYVGDAAGALGDMAAARAAYAAGTRLIEPLVRRAPDNVEWTRDLISAHMRLGNLALETGDAPGAIRAARNEVVLAEALLARDPDNALYLGDRAYGLIRLGTALAASGDASAAADVQRHVLDDIAALRKATGDAPRWQAAAASSEHALAEALQALGDAMGAARSFERARFLRAGLIAAGQADAATRNGLVATVLKLTELAANAGRPGPALTLLAPALDEARALLAEAPDDPRARRTLAILHYREGELHLQAGATAPAATAFAEAAALRRALAADIPDRALLWTELADTLGQQAEALWAAGDLAPLVALLDEAADAAVRGIEGDPFSGPAHWVYLETLFRQSVAAADGQPYMEHALDQAEWMHAQGMLGPDGGATLEFLRAQLAAGGD